MEDSDGFTRVRRRGGRPTPTPSAAPGLCSQPTMGLKALKKSIRQHLEELSPAFQSSALASVAPRPLLEESGPGDCGELPAGGGAPLVCYGLGSPSCAAGSRLQTALLLLLRQRLRGCQTALYDPVFTAVDRQLFAEYGLTEIAENEECFRPVGSQDTVFYMPHGSWAMYNNVLFSNWSRDALSRIVIIGNDFRDLEDRITGKKFRRTYRYVYLCLRHGMCEFNKVSLAGTEMAGTALITFPAARLPAAAHECWRDAARPDYAHSEERELVSRANNLPVNTL